MASISQKVPIPLPTAGVLRDKNPRTIGATGLSDSSNWIYRDGYFTVRNGLKLLLEDDTDSINLFPAVSTVTYESIDSITVLNDDNLLPGIPHPPASASPPITAIITAETPPSTLRTEWLAWGPGDTTLLTAGLTSPDWQAGDSDWLNNGGDGYPQLDLAKGETVRFCSPMVPIGVGYIDAQVKTEYAGDPDYLEFELMFVKWGNDEYRSIIQVSDYTFDPDLEIPEPPDGLMRGTAYNDGNYNYAFFRVSVATADVGTKFSWGEAMINYGDGSTAQVYDPPTTGDLSAIGERPMAITKFEQDNENSVTVAATDKAWWQLQSDNTWVQIEGSEWNVSPAERGSLPVFRTFDGKIGTGDAKRYLIGVNGESNAIAWDGSAAAFQIEKFDTTPAAYLQPSCLAVNANRMLYGGTPQIPDGVYYTADLSIDNWGVTAGSTVRLADTPGEIVGMMEMGNLQTAVYKTDAIYMAIGQGGAIPFRFDLKTAHVEGPASSQTIVGISDGMHMYLTETGDIVVFDGVRPRSMGKHLQSYVKETMNAAMMNTAFGFYDVERKEVYFFYPPYNGSESLNCIIVNVSSDFPTLWPQRLRDNVTCGGRVTLNLSKTIDELGLTPIMELEGTIDDYGEERPLLLVLDNTGRPHTFSGNDDNGYAIESRLRTGLFDMGSITQYKTVKEIDHLINVDDNQTIYVDLMKSDFGYEEESTGEYEVTVASGRRKLSSHRATGRLFAMNFRAETTGPVEWLGSEAAVALRGFR